MTDVLLPQLGETVTEGTITRWAKKVGDEVQADEVLFEISTDKVDSEVPSPISGILQEIRVQEGETADVGSVLAVIGDSKQEEEGSPAEARTEPPEDGEQTADTQAVGHALSEPEPAPEAAGTTASVVAQEEAARAAAPATSPSNDTGPTAQKRSGLGGRVLSPVVRKLIRDNNLDSDLIPGSGLGGRITREDVQDYLQHGGDAPGPSQDLPADTGSSGQVQRPPALPPAVGGARDEIVPFSNIRRRTAEHMIMSKATSAHTLVTIEVDYDNVDRVRNAQKAKFKSEEGISLTYLPFITRALVDAVREFPYLNASVGDNELIVHREVNVGIAVDLAFEGLLVPVLHGTDGLRLRQIGRGIADLASRARNKKLQADDISGGTFTITNAGGYGTFITYPVINQPQVAILSTDGVKKRPVAIELPDGSDAIVVHPVGQLGLAWDHRAFDGAYASAFLARVKDVLETRDWLSEL